jgi:hypothetical protein
MQPRAVREEASELLALAYMHAHELGAQELGARSSKRGAETRGADQALFLYAICAEQSKCSTLSIDSQPALKQGMPARTHTTLFEEESDHMVLVLRGCPRAASFSSHVPRACVRRRAHRLPVPVLIAGASARARGGAKHGTARAFHGEQASALHQPERERERKEEQDRRDGERCC